MNVCITLGSNEVNAKMHGELAKAHSEMGSSRGGGAGGQGLNPPNSNVGGRAPPMLALFMGGIQCRHMDWETR